MNKFTRITSLIILPIVLISLLIPSKSFAFSNTLGVPKIINSAIVMATLMAYTPFETVEKDHLLTGGITSGIVVPLKESTHPTIGGKLMFYMKPYAMIGGGVDYIYMGDKGHEGQVKFIWDFNLRLASRVDFLIGSDIGFSGSKEGPALFVKPGIGLLFHLKPVAFEVKTGVWIPWWMAQNEFSVKSVRFVATLSVLFEG